MYSLDSQEMKTKQTFILLIVLAVILLLTTNLHQKLLKATGKPKSAQWSFREFQESEFQVTKNETDSNFDQFGVKKHLPTVALGIAVTSQGITDMSANVIRYNFVFFQSFLSSFCKTSTQGYSYHFYVAYDQDDPFYSNETRQQWFKDTFKTVTTEQCSYVTNMVLHLVHCNHSTSPAWAQNDAMMEAYLNDHDYYYRVNDDTILRSAGWTERFITALQGMNPPNVGVIGPRHFNGNMDILTYEFVHRTHIDIFGFYYPRIFTDWFADDWINNLYQPEYFRKIHDVKVVHTQNLGTRYQNRMGNALYLRQQVLKDKKTLLEYLIIKRVNITGAVKPVIKDARKAVVLTLPDYTASNVFGVIRNAHLTNLLLPEWEVYVIHPQDLVSSTRVTTKLKVLGVHLIPYSANASSCLMPLVLLGNEHLRWVVFKEARQRLSGREAEGIQDWSDRLNSTWHCTIDHPVQIKSVISPGLIGVNLQLLKLKADINRLIHQFETKLMGTAKDWTYEKCLRNNIVKEFLLSQNLVTTDLACHIGLNCTVPKMVKQVVPLTPRPYESEFCGQYFDEHEMPENDTEMVIWQQWRKQPSCSTGSGIT